MQNGRRDEKRTKSKEKKLKYQRVRFTIDMPVEKSNIPCCRVPLFEIGEEITSRRYDKKGSMLVKNPVLLKLPASDRFPTAFSKILKASQIKHPRPTCKPTAETARSQICRTMIPTSNRPLNIIQPNIKTRIIDNGTVEQTSHKCHAVGLIYRKLLLVVDPVAPQFRRKGINRTHANPSRSQTFQFTARSTSVDQFQVCVII
uniref:Uncharacterized protein n=1 Tax=Romanomermis culicivorax TaxID=13658 RepID=A0A915K6B0_ROMCU